MFQMPRRFFTPVIIGEDEVVGTPPKGSPPCLQRRFLRPQVDIDEKCECATAQPLGRWLNRAEYTPAGAAMVKPSILFGGPGL
ncbi:MAG TPA: hypothetical protein VN788_10125 [Verrucomicrobiae bacterium]|nr:hypothetical protein [Verrucomicrobiae bacterium]